MCAHLLRPARADPGAVAAVIIHTARATGWPRPTSEHLTSASKERFHARLPVLGAGRNAYQLHAMTIAQ